MPPAGPAAPSLRGVTAPRRAELLVQRPLPVDAVRLDPAGDLGAWQARNRAATVPHCIAELEPSGVLPNLRAIVDGRDEPFVGFMFADSDLHKTLEAVAWELGRADDVSLRAFLDSSADLLARTQEPDGYLDSRFQGSRAGEQWTDLEWGHEMYVAGHLIQAAVATARTVGPHRLVDVARRVADMLVRRFAAPDALQVCGHPEIETALVELYRETGEPSYLDLASRMIDARGRGLLGEIHFGAQYFQDHLPVRETTEANGHAVRQLYLAAGATDVYLETGDRSLLGAMEQLWESAFLTKTYLTGGQGSRHRDEAFGDPYELPSDRAYAETCAAIASFMWCWRMLLATGEGRYADEMERALHNAIAVGVSQDGTRFFYSNPLQLRPGHDGSTEDAPSERLPWYRCACCPPNLARLVASLHGYVATVDDDGVSLQLFTAGVVRADTPAGTIALAVRTDHPWDGTVEVEVIDSPGTWTLSLRVPAWASGATVAAGGDARPAATDAQGYLRLRRDWRPGERVTLSLPMPVRLVRAHPAVDAVRGSVALMRGPIVFAVEDADLEPGVSIDELRLDPSAPPEAVRTAGAPAPIVLRGQARRSPVEKHAPLYGDVGRPEAALMTTTFGAVPYQRWGNRGAHTMRVWLPVLEP